MHPRQLCPNCACCYGGRTRRGSPGSGRARSSSDSDSTEDWRRDELEDQQQLMEDLEEWGEDTDDFFGASF